MEYLYVFLLGLVLALSGTIAASVQGKKGTKHSSVRGRNASIVVAVIGAVLAIGALSAKYMINKTDQSHLPFDLQLPPELINTDPVVPGTGSWWDHYGPPTQYEIPYQWVRVR